MDIANEHIEDLRRAADKHNAIARMKAAGQETSPGKEPDKKQQNLWERVRNSLR
jgi:hypothetical protein